ncbi:Uncharacterised protein [Chlamydia trachomatis]|nr:Uncharacterised protein [Chlamydia trachomatis]CRH88746.1 Uncharacterised protein [Chlamydia trachomatis]
MNRGHLIGYQFSGLNDELRNLTPLTAWINSGNYSGMDSGNAEGMLFYENKLDTHPNFWLDYKVTPVYNGNELIPRQIELQYVGLDNNGNLLTIQLGGGKETVDAYGVTRVTLSNYSPNAQIDYLTGRATNTLNSSKTPATSVTPASEPIPSSNSTPAPAPETTAPATVESRTVYIARQGKADVYWYDSGNMPANTNWDNVITMSEQEALNLGKRHTSKE